MMRRSKWVIKTFSLKTLRSREVVNLSLRYARERQFKSALRNQSQDPVINSYLPPFFLFSLGIGDTVAKELWRVDK